MRKMIIPLIAVLFAGVLFGQSINGNYELNYVTVHYTYEVRDTLQQDSEGNPVTVNYDTEYSDYTAWLVWPNREDGIFWYPASDFDIGDTLGTLLVPLVNQTLLDAAGYLLTGDPTSPGVAINIDLYDSPEDLAGTFTINQGSTYPTTSMADCSTFAVVPGVQETGAWTDGGYDPVVNGDEYWTQFGWGITESGIFAHFNAPNLLTMVNGTDYGSGTDMPNWGMMKIDYDAEFSQPQAAEIYWEAHDGPESSLGIVDPTDDLYEEAQAGLLNGVVGVAEAPGDTVTISAIATMASSYGITIHVPDHPVMLAGPGIVDGDGNPVIDPNTGEPYGTDDFKRGYMFDPVGADGIPLNGDEPLQFTGYFFTWNDLLAAAVFEEVFWENFDEDAADQAAELQAAATIACTAVCMTFGVDEATAATLAAGLATQAIADITALMATGYSLEDAAYEVLLGLPFMTLGAMVANLGMDFNDSDHDMDLENDYTFLDTDGDGYPDTPYSENGGRLTMVVDNSCIPVQTTQRVNPKFYETSTVQVDKDAPLATEFKLMGNFPNPFNPVTKIRFSTVVFSDVNITIYSILGDEIATVFNDKLAPGTYNIAWKGQDKMGNKVPSGVYFYQVTSNERTLKGKMLLLK